MRPELFKAVIARVPFTNLITAMLDPDLPLTVIEWEQWGNPYHQAITRHLSERQSGFPRLVPPATPHPGASGTAPGQRPGSSH
jgi:oligopeptidase B